MLLIDPKTDNTFFNNDIFKVLNQYSPGLPKDLRPRIKSAMRAGRAVSVDVSLATRRSVVMKGSELFSTYWTPLKNEHAVVKYVVVTFAAHGQE
jgi:hypothetical protein